MRTSTCEVESKRKRKSATGNPSTGRCCIGEQLDDISFGCEFGMNTLIPNSHLYLLFTCGLVATAFIVQ